MRTVNWVLCLNSWSQDTKNKKLLRIMRIFFLICFQIPVSIFLFMLNKFRGIPGFFLFFLLNLSLPNPGIFDIVKIKFALIFSQKGFLFYIYSLVRLISLSYKQHTWYSKYIRNVKRQHSKYVLLSPLTSFGFCIFEFLLYLECRVLV